MLVRIADLCVHLGTATEAARLQALMMPMADLCATEGVLVSFGASARALGELAAKSGDHAQAEVHLRAALAINERASHRPERAKTMLALSDVLSRRGHTREAGQFAREARAEVEAMRLVLFATPQS